MREEEGEKRSKGRREKINPSAESRGEGCVKMFIEGNRRNDLIFYSLSHLVGNERGYIHAK